MIDFDKVTEVANWCSFCNAEPAQGSVTGMFPVGPGGELEEYTLDIGPNCLKVVAEKDLLVGLDTADDQ